MRQHLIPAIFLAQLAIVATASADARGRKAAGKPIDTKGVIDKLDVYRDDTGKYYVSPKRKAFTEDHDEWVFYGDGKKMYQQRVIGSSTDDHGHEWVVWSPRVRGLSNAFLELKQGGFAVSCRQKHKTTLAQLPADEAKQLIRRAKFYPPYTNRVARFLARDDDGVYFYVDQLREEDGGKGFRVFVGLKGAMKQVVMTNVVSDSAGDIFATKTGELKIVAGADNKAYWKKGNKKRELIVLELGANRYLMYRELGIYGQLGVICDDQ